MFKNRPLQFELSIRISLLVVSMLLLLSVLFYLQFRQALQQRVLLQLSSIRQLKINQISSHLNLIWQNFSKEEVSANFIILQAPDFDTIFIPGDQLFYGNSLSTIWNDLLKAKDGMFDLGFAQSNGHLILGLKRKIRTNAIFIRFYEARRIQEILLERTGLGETGESYLVGADFHLRSLSRFFPDSVSTFLKAETSGVQYALAGQEGTGLFPDYRNIPVFSAYGPLRFSHIRWAILSEIDKSEALRPLDDAKNKLVIILITLIVLTLFAAWKLTSHMVLPITQMKNHLLAMAKGNFSLQIDIPDRSLEVNAMFQALHQMVHSVNQAKKFANEIGQMKLDANYHPLGPEDSLGIALIQMRDQLRIFHRKSEEYQLSTQRALWQGEENERARLSRDLHDGLGPLLTSLKMMIQRLEISENSKEKIKSLIDDTIQEIRRMTFNLRPQSLVDFGVGKALENLVQIMSRASGIDIKYVNDLSYPVSEEINTGLYRIAQEALNNGVKHSGAQHIRMSLTGFPEYISFYYKDDGHGIDEQQDLKGTGILNMRERCRVMKGTFKMFSDQTGTILEIEIPRQI